jgi:L-phenylalanine/L-methionine N-acetyltransferase
MAVTVRRAKLADAAPLVAHLRELAAEPGINVPLAADEITLTVEEEREVIEDLADSNRAALFVAIGDGALVGELTIRGISPRRAVRHVATLGMSVKQGWRRRGVGEALLAEALAWSRRHGFTRVELYVYTRNAPAIALYRKLGFEIEGTRRRFIREGDAYLDDHVMARLEEQR